MKKNLGISRHDGNLDFFYNKSKSMKCPDCGEVIYKTYARDENLDMGIFAGWGPCGCSFHDFDGEGSQGRKSAPNAFVN